ncbi:MAG: hypothetical protein WAV20_05895 [Blastocatellia bacterium]
MVSSLRSSSIWGLLIAMTVVTLSTLACRNHSKPGNGDPTIEPAGAEPEQYSATVVRTVDDGTTRQVSIIREARLFEKRREDWSEDGQNRALIWTPEFGKGFLLDLDRRAYVEIEIAGPSDARISDPRQGRHRVLGSLDAESEIQTLERSFDDAPSPTSVETRSLDLAVIDGHSCTVLERRSSYPDGHTEIVTTFRARDLAGLALRVETRSDQPLMKILTERREIRLEVPPEEFIVPGDFAKVERLPR